MTLKHDPKFYDALNRFVAMVNHRYEVYWQAMGYTHGKAPIVEIDPNGRKYIRLVKRDRDTNGEVIERGGSVFAFINTDTGGVHKPASWAAPVTKNVRGNIMNDDNGAEAVTPEGAHPFIVYLRG